MPANKSTVPGRPDWLADDVALGDDGYSVNPPPDEGAAITYIKQWFAQQQVEQVNNFEAALTRHRQRIIANQPAYAPQFASASIPASGNLVLDLGGPQLGRRWVVRMVTFSDAVSFWASMGSADVALCVGRKTGATVSPQMVRWPFPEAPNSATFGSDQMWVNPQDHVLLAITGGTSGQNVQCTLWIQDFDVMAVSGGEFV